MKNRAPKNDDRPAKGAKSNASGKLQNGGDISTAPEEGNGEPKSASVRRAEQQKTDESGAVID